MASYGIDRCIDVFTSGSQKTFEVITFTDASKKAYAAATYLKISAGSRIETNLVISKVRLAPIKEISIPRLELLGVLIGCRLSKFVAEELGMPEVKRKIFTDSKCVLEWYKSEKDLKRFVNDKIKEIKSHAISL